MKRDILKDAAITYEDVDLPPERLIDRLRAEQDESFGARAERLVREA